MDVYYNFYSDFLSDEPALKYNLKFVTINKSLVEINLYECQFRRIKHDTLKIKETRITA